LAANLALKANNIEYFYIRSVIHSRAIQAGKSLQGCAYIGIGLIVALSK
jgi:hypothetical protein